MTIVNHHSGLFSIHQLSQFVVKLDSKHWTHIGWKWGLIEHSLGLVYVTVGCLTHEFQAFHILQVFQDYVFLETHFSKQNFYTWNSFKWWLTSGDRWCHVVQIGRSKGVWDRTGFCLQHITWHPHRNIQRSVSRVILNPIKLTVKIKPPQPAVCFCSRKRCKRQFLKDCSYTKMSQWNFPEKDK